MFDHLSVGSVRFWFDYYVQPRFHSVLFGLIEIRSVRLWNGSENSVRFCRFQFYSSPFHPVLFDSTAFSVWFFCSIMCGSGSIIYCLRIGSVRVGPVQFYSVLSDSVSNAPMFGSIRFDLARFFQVGSVRYERWISCDILPACFLVVVLPSWSSLSKRMPLPFVCVRKRSRNGGVSIVRNRYYIRLAPGTQQARLAQQYNSSV